MLNRGSDLNWMFQYKITLCLAIQNLHRLQAIILSWIKCEVLIVNRNHVQHVSQISFQNDKSILLIQTLGVVLSFKKRLDSSGTKPKNTSGMEHVC